MMCMGNGFDMIAFTVAVLGVPVGYVLGWLIWGRRGKR